MMLKSVRVVRFNFGRRHTTKLSSFNNVVRYQSTSKDIPIPSDAVEASSSFFPDPTSIVDSIPLFLETIHTTTGLPWWATLMVFYN